MKFDCKDSLESSENSSMIKHFFEIIVLASLRSTNKAMNTEYNHVQLTSIVDKVFTIFLPRKRHIGKKVTKYCTISQWTTVDDSYKG